MGNLATPEKLQKLRTALHAKAKEEPACRFYLLYDKICRDDILTHAYHLCRANKGAAGVDGQRFADIETYGERRWIGELADRLRAKDYRPEAVKRVWIPKPNGKLRPLGIPTITDRVVQTAAVLVLGPIFEADLAPEQYAYRADRGAHDAVRAVHRLLNAGHTEVVEADLSGYFDSIPHAELMKSVARRIVDRNVLRLIKGWLNAPIEEDDERRGSIRTTPNRDSRRGTPQGSPISPLLSNIYMRRFILGWKKLGLADRWSAHIVNYADDFVICCRTGAEHAMAAMRDMVGALGLTVNDDKTRLCTIPEDRFDFLGYTFGTCYSRRDGHAYLGTKPSRKSIKALMATISQETDTRMTWQQADMVVAKLNRMMRGWRNYFCLGHVSPAYRGVDRHAQARLRRWLCRKHKVRGDGRGSFPDQHLYRTLGLVQLPKTTRDLPWAKA